MARAARDFRTTGQVELWEPWAGTVRPLANTAQTAAGTRLKLPLTDKEIQLIVFRPGPRNFRGAGVSKPIPATKATMA